MYRDVIEAFPDAILEDPHDLPAAQEVIAPHAGRVSYDAPIHPAATSTRRPQAVRDRQHQAVPDRQAPRAARALRRCETAGWRCTAEAWASSGVARGQIQLLASLFHPDGPDDIFAPTGFNALDPAAGLPASPRAR